MKRSKSEYEYSMTSENTDGECCQLRKNTVDRIIYKKVLNVS